MYKVFVDNLAHLQVMLGINDSEYVDVFLTEERVLLITNTTELMALVSLPCSRSVMDVNTSFRVARGMLRNLASNGGMDISVSEESVRIDFFTDEGMRYCTASFEKLPVFNTAYVDKVKLVETVHVSNYVNTDELTGLLRVCRAAGGALSVTGGVASASASQTIKVCRRINCVENFTVSPASLEALRKCNKNIFSAENYLCAFQDNLAIVAVKSRHSMDDTVEYLLNDPGGAKYKATLDFYTLVTFLQASRIKIPNVTVNVATQKCTLDCEGVQYSVPVPVKGAACAAGAEFSKFELPFSVVRNVMVPLKRTSFLVSRKKHFMELKEKDYTIYFN